MRKYTKIDYAERNATVNKLCVFLPDEGERFPVLLYFHGAGVIHADCDISYEPFTQYLTQNGIAVVCASYHQFPYTSGKEVVKYTDILEDAVDAVKWVKTSLSAYCQADKLFIGGSSHGGYPAAMLCFNTSLLNRCELTPIDIDGFIFDSPQLTTHYSALKEKGYAYNRVMIDESAPLYYVGTEKEYPPMLFINADNDSHTRLSQTKLTVTALKNLGHTAPKIQSVVLEGTHCSYVNDQNNVFGEIIHQFMESAK